MKKKKLGICNEKLMSIGTKSEKEEGDKVIGAFSSDHAFRTQSLYLDHIFCVAGSQHLPGCPSFTDSEVKRNVSDMMELLIWSN